MHIVDKYQKNKKIIKTDIPSGWLYKDLFAKYKPKIRKVEGDY